LRRLAAVALVSAWPALARAQAPRFEAGGQVLGLLADQDYLGAGPWLGWRVVPSFRLGLLVTLGSARHQTAGRMEVTGHYLLDPDRISGVSPYLAAGAAWNVADESRAYLLIGVGLESAPAKPGGWVVELGLGGGWRATAGYRWRFGRRRSGR